MKKKLIVLGLNQLDAQTLTQKQMHPNFMSQFNTPNNNSLTTNNKNLIHQNYSFEEQLPQNYYDGGVNHRLNLLQQAQSHSFNMDMLNSVAPNQQDFLQQYSQISNAGNSLFQRNNPKRNTLRRAQRVADSSVEDLTGAGLIDLAGLSPQQQQQLMLMRNQQFSNNSSGQESGLGTGSSVYTNSAPLGAHDLLQQHQIHQQQRNLNDLIKNDMLNNNPNNQALAGNANNLTSQNASTADHLLLQPPPQLPRRKSLPSIVKSKSFKEDETAHSSSDLNNKNEETFIIENGIRKRVTEKSNSLLTKMNNENGARAGVTGEIDYDTALPKRYNFDDEDQTPQLPRKILLESVTSIDSPKSNSKRVSMPSIPAYLSPKFANKGTKQKRIIIIKK